MPREPLVLGQPTRPWSASTSRATSATSCTCAQARRARIEVDAQLVGVIEIFRTHGVRVELEAAEARHPRQRRRLARHHLFGRATAGERERRDLDERGPRARRALLPEVLALDAVRITNEHVGSSTRAAQGAFCDGDEVRDHLALRDLRVGEVDLVGARDRQHASSDLDLFALGLLRHGALQRTRAARTHGQ
jgi:hypothetical protein